jgi:cytochrome oxidase assembly protein ShyY1
LTVAVSRSRLVALTVTAVVVSALCVVAGWWQWQRTQEALDLERATIAEPVAVADAADVDGFPAMSVGRSAYASGEYADQQIYVGPRAFEGRSGWWVLTPLTTEGETVVVLRGWVEDRGAAATAIPTGPVSVSGTLQPFETFYADRPRSPEGDLVVASRPEIEAEWGAPVISLLFVLAEQDPASDPGLVPVAPTVAAGGAPFPWQNAAYTVQWFVFAGFAWVMWWMWAIRGRRDEANADSLAT